MTLDQMLFVLHATKIEISNCQLSQSQQLYRHKQTPKCTIPHADQHSCLGQKIWATPDSRGNLQVKRDYFTNTDSQTNPRAYLSQSDQHSCKFSWLAQAG
jgi:hypothetical protein